MNSYAKILIVAIVFAVSVSAVGGILLSDGSDAAAEPASLDVRDLSGNSISGKGAILDDASMDVRTDTVQGTSGRIYTVEAGDVLIDGSLYVIVDSPKSISYSLSVSVFNFNQTAQAFGLRFSLFSDSGCTGTPMASTVFDSSSYNERIFADSLVSGTPYYIQVATVTEYVSESAPSVGGVGFGLTASLDPEYNAIYYVSDGEQVASMLVRNGSHYTFPEISKEGYTLIGWYGSEDYAELYRTSDVVDLDSDLTLYAFWWAGGSEHIVYETLDGTSVEIDVDVGEKVSIRARAVTEDGKISASVVSGDISDTHIPIGITVETDGTVGGEDAERCVSSAELLSIWMEGKGLHPEPSAEVGTGPVSLDALKVFSDNGFSLKTGGGETSVSLDPEAVAGLYRGALSTLTGLHPSGTDLGNCEIVLAIREALRADLTSAQAAAADGDIWYIAFLADGVEVHGIGGEVTVTVPFSTRYSDPTVTVCHIADDGTKTETPSVFSEADGTVVFTTDHLSIYSVSVTSDSSSGTGITLYTSFVLAAVIVSVLLVSFGMPSPRRS